MLFAAGRAPPPPLPPGKIDLRRSRAPSPLTERLEDVGGGLVHIVDVQLVALGAVLHPLALLLVAGLAAVAPPPVVALGNVHADVHGVVTCQDNTTSGVGGRVGGRQVRLHWKQEITLILRAANPHHQLKDKKEKGKKTKNNWNWSICCDRV